MKVHVGRPPPFTTCPISAQRGHANPERRPPSPHPWFVRRSDVRRGAEWEMGTQEGCTREWGVGCVPPFAPTLCGMEGQGGGQTEWEGSTRMGGGAPPPSRNRFCANGCAQKVCRGVGEVRVHVQMGGGAHPPFLCPQSCTNCGGTQLGGGCKKGRRGGAGMGRGAPPLALCACPCLRKVGATCKPAPPRPGFHAGVTSEWGWGHAE